ncbi:MAG TPA: alpha/beta fold hydrolase [Candidatus Acidoferrales bacterium]|nr:alpha/beta fold hydrolase [Candidatus Acidoferrales bacterium]
MQAQINGLQVWFDELGNPGALPVVLIHGFPFSHEMWRPQIPVLSEKFWVIQYDLRGHGQTDVGDGQYALEFFVDDLIALLDYLKIKKAVLCGLSMGGYIALRAVERNPERVFGLILADTQAKADSNEAKLKRAASIKAVKSNGIKPFADNFLNSAFTPQSLTSKSEGVIAIQKIIDSNSQMGICGALLALASRTDTTVSLLAVQVPTLILVGDRDVLTPVSLSQELHDRIRDSEMHVIKNAAHLSNLENAEEFNKYVVDFLNRLKWQ